MPRDNDPLVSQMKEWAAGRSFWWRLPLFLFLAFQTMGPLREQGESTLFSAIIFGSHEFGHLFWSLLGEWIGIAGGSLTQLLIPIGAAALVYKSRDWFGVAVCGVFLASSLADLSWYIGDARTEMLDLVSFSPDGAIHDWNYLLGRAGMLGLDLRLASFTRFVAWMVLLASTVLAGRLLWWMATSKENATDSGTAAA